MKEMGEVRVMVKMVNYEDEVLVRHGALSPDLVRHLEVEAVVDTGAVRCVVPQIIAEQLGLERLEERVACYADGRSEAVPLSSAFQWSVQGRKELDNALILGQEVLIGQTLLEKLHLLVDCPNQRLIPNPQHPIQPVYRV